MQNIWCHANAPLVKTMPKAKLVSLHPLTLDEAIKAIINVDPEKVGIVSKRREEAQKKSKRHAPKPLPK
jgi:hypothetical protein